MLLATPALFWEPPGFDWIEFQKKQKSRKQILISKTKTDVLITNWARISPTYPIHNRTLLCVSLWMDYHSKAFPLFYLLLHSSCLGGHGPPLTVISLDEFIIHFPSHSNTSPYLFWKHHCYWSLLTPWLYNSYLAPGRLFRRVHTNPNWCLHLDSYFYHLLPLDVRHHIMILLLLSLLLQSKLHTNILPITHPAPKLAYLFRTLNLTHHLLSTSNPTLASDCWICLSISSHWGSALPISRDKWTHLNTSLYHTYREESLFLSYIPYLYSIDQIHNPNKILISLLTDLTSTHKGPAIGGPTSSNVHLQWQTGSFVFPGKTLWTILTPN